MSESKFKEVKFTDADVVNWSDYIPKGEYNPRKVRPWLLHNNGFVLAVVFASCEGDAVDIACDEDKLDQFLLSEEDLEDYDDEGSGISYLGNASEPFDIEEVTIMELPNPAFSFCALFNAMLQGAKK